MVKQAKMNRLVSEADIPPPVAIATLPHVNTPTVPPQIQAFNPQKISPTGASVVAGQNDGEFSVWDCFDFAFEMLLFMSC